MVEALLIIISILLAIVVDLIRAQIKNQKRLMKYWDDFFSGKLKITMHHQDQKHFHQYNDVFKKHSFSLPFRRIKETLQKIEEHLQKLSEK